MTAPGWWDARSPREQALLAGAAALALGLVLWAALLAPAAAYAERERARAAQATQALGDVRQLAGQAAGGSRRAARAARSESVQLLVARRAGEAGLSLASLEAPDGGRATLAIEAVRPVVLFAWLDALEARDGVRVETLAIARNDDASLAVRATLAGDGGA
jgi:general secretion pathway protein M